MSYTTLITPERYGDMLPEDQLLYLEVWQFFRPKAGFWQTDPEAPKTYKSFERYQVLNPDLQVRRMYRYKLAADQDGPVEKPERIPRPYNKKAKANPAPAPIVKEKVIEKVVIKEVEKVVTIKQVIEVPGSMVRLSAELSIYKEELLSKPLGSLVRQGAAMAFVGIEELLAAHLPKPKKYKPL